MRCAGERPWSATRFSDAVLSNNGDIVTVKNSMGHEDITMPPLQGRLAEDVMKGEVEEIEEVALRRWLSWVGGIVMTLRWNSWGLRGACGVVQAWTRLFLRECRVLWPWWLMQCWDSRRLAEAYPIRFQLLYGEFFAGCPIVFSAREGVFCVRRLWCLQICCSEATEEGLLCFRPISRGV